MRMPRATALMGRSNARATSMWVMRGILLEMEHIVKVKIY